VPKGGKKTDGKTRVEDMGEGGRGSERRGKKLVPPTTSVGAGRRNRGGEGRGDTGGKHRSALKEIEGREEGAKGPSHPVSIFSSRGKKRISEEKV